MLFSPCQREIQYARPSAILRMLVMSLPRALEYLSFRTDASRKTIFPVHSTAVERIRQLSQINANARVEVKQEELSLNLRETFALWPRWNREKRSRRSPKQRRRGNACLQQFDPVDVGAVVLVRTSETMRSRPDSFAD